MMRRLAKDSKGATAIEYGLIASLIGVAMMALPLNGMSVGEHIKQVLLVANVGMARGCGAGYHAGLDAGGYANCLPNAE